MGTTLILPDLHLRWAQAQKIIDNVPHDEVIFLGDFFDDFGDDPQQVGEMCDWLEAAVKRKNWRFIYGNHDLHYAYAYRHLKCSGYADWKYFIIHDRFDGRKIWDRFEWYVVLDGKWLLTHAGLHESNVPKDIAKLHTDRPKFLKELSSYLDAQARLGLQGHSWCLNAGSSRGGHQAVGGIIWCDFNDEFYPVKGLNQIFGHTPQGQGARWCCQKGKSKPSLHPIELWKPNQKGFNDVEQSFNVDLDVWKNTHWAVWDGEELTFGNYNKLMHELANT
jgi:hypothetical protein